MWEQLRLSRHNTFQRELPAFFILSGAYTCPSPSLEVGQLDAPDCRHADGLFHFNRDGVAAAAIYLQYITVQ
jgi:hypothetical protein